MKKILIAGLLILSIRLVAQLKTGEDDASFQNTANTRVLINEPGSYIELQMKKLSKGAICRKLDRERVNFDYSYKKNSMTISVSGFERQAPNHCQVLTWGNMIAGPLRQGEMELSLPPGYSLESRKIYHAGESRNVPFSREGSTGPLKIELKKPGIIRFSFMRPGTGRCRERFTVGTRPGKITAFILSEEKKEIHSYRICRARSIAHGEISLARDEGIYYFENHEHLESIKKIDLLPQ